MSDLFNNMQTFYQSNTEIAIAILAAIIAILIFKPKAAGKILSAIALIIVVGYLVVTLTDLTGSTKDSKSEAAHRTDREAQKPEQ